MRKLLILATALSGSITLLAQREAPTAKPATTTLLNLVPSNGCPVQLTAHRLPEAGLVAVSPRPEGKRPGPLSRSQPLRLTFWPGNARAITQADITLHGMSGSAVVPAGGNGRANATENLSITPTPEPNHLLIAVVYVKRLTVVQWVELNELRFADGTEWHASADAVCRVAPSLYRPVVARK